MSEDRLGAIIVARLDSQRFPGKVLHPLLGRPLLGHVAQRCRQSVAIGNRVVVATTSRPIDLPIAKFALAQDLGVFRGDTHNVARRLLECAEALGWDGFFRVNADSPCLDPELFDRAAEIFAAGSFDLITNLHPRSFPYGVSVELIRTTTFARAYRRFDQPGHREHATSFLYEHADEFRLHNLTNPDPSAPRPRLTVDTPEDLAQVEAHLATLGGQGSAAPSPAPAPPILPAEPAAAAASAPSSWSIGDAPRARPAEANPPLAARAPVAPNLRPAFNGTSKPVPALA
jgi:spore coat polysaccharide biosynthesis protein SpsF (cytidylyltransferase family)